MSLAEAVSWLSSIETRQSKFASNDEELFSDLYQMENP